MKGFKAFGWLALACIEDWKSILFCSQGYLYLEFENRSILLTPTA